MTEDEFHWSAIREIVENFGGKCRIGREHHKDGGIHYHAFCVKEERFVFRRSDKFDINGHHPNITQVTRTPERAWKYVAKESVVYDGIPEPPSGRSKKRTNADVWRHILSADDRDSMLKRVEEGQPEKFCTSFNNIVRAAEHKHPTNSFTDYTSPPGLSHELDLFPEITEWQQRYLPTRYPEEPCLLPQSPSTDGRSLSSGTGDELASEGTGVDSFFGSDCELPRYVKPCATKPVRATNMPQPRPKSLIIWGPSQLGKTLVARSFGRHSYFADLFNLDEFDADADYAVFDDMRKGFREFNYKGFLGGQHQFNASDKYKKKRTILFGKPSVMLLNDDPLKMNKGYVDIDWLMRNTVIVHVDSPICNLAREAV